MPELAVASHSPSGTVPVNRCLELRPVLDQLGLRPLVIGVGRIVIGSRTSHGLNLEVDGLAPEHAEVEFDGQRARLRVISPLTWLNDGPVREATLRPGDLLTLGPVEFKVGIVDVPAPPPPPTATVPPLPIATASARAMATVAAAKTDLRKVTRPPSAAPNAPTVGPAKGIVERSPAAAPRPTGVRADALPKSSTVPREAPASVQPLLEEAAAARSLRQDLSRLEEETAWHREHLQKEPLPGSIAALPQSKSEVAGPETVSRPESPAKESAFKGITLAQQESLWRDREEHWKRTLAESENKLTRHTEEQQRLLDEHQRLLREVEGLTAQSSNLRDTEQAIRREQSELSTARSELKSQQEELRQQRQEISTLRARLDEERAELSRREQAQAEQQAEFDSAVAALDLDREQTRRSSEAAQREAAQQRQRIERQQAELQEQAQALAAEETRLRKLDDDCDARELHCEEKLRQHSATQREREAQLARREVALRGREAALKAGQEDLETRRRQLQSAEDALLAAREELATLQDEARQLHGEAQRQLRDVETDRERLGKRQAVLAERTAQFDTEWERLVAQRAEVDQSLFELQARSTAIEEREVELQRLLAARNSQDSHEHSQGLYAATGFTAPTVDEGYLAEQRRQLEADRTAWMQEQADATDRLHAELDRLSQWESELQQRAEAFDSETAVAAQAMPAESELRAELDQRAALIRAQEEAMAEAVAALEQHRSELDQREADLQSRADALAVKQSEITSPSGDQAAPVEELTVDAPTAAEWQALVAELMAERDQFQSELQAALEAHSAIEEEFRWLQAEADRTTAEREHLRQSQSELDRRAAELDAAREKLAAKEHQSESQRDIFREQQAELDAERDGLLDERRQLEALRAALREDQDAQAPVERSTRPAVIARPQDIFADPSEEIAEEETGVDPVRSSASFWFSGGADKNPADFAGRERSTVPAPAASSLNDANIFELETDGEQTAPAMAGHAAPFTPERRSEPRESIQPEATTAKLERTAAAEPAGNTGIRSQLAMLFGISARELDEAATRHGDELGTVETAVDDEEAIAVARERELATQLKSVDRVVTPRPEPVVPPAAASNDAPQGEDTVAAYMQRLLAKSALGDSSIIPPPEATTPSKQPVEVTPNRDEPSRVADPEADEDEAGERSAGAPRAGRRLDRTEREEIRANIDSMRQIANLSARSAVARHYASKLEVTKRVKMMLAGMAGGLSLLLLTAELWTDNSYRLPGICAGVVAIIAVLELVRTSIQMKRVRQIAGVQSEAGDDAE